MWSLYTWRSDGISFFKGHAISQAPNLAYYSVNYMQIWQKMKRICQHNHNQFCHDWSQTWANKGFGSEFGGLLLGFEFLEYLSLTRELCPDIWPLSLHFRVTLMTRKTQWSLFLKCNLLLWLAMIKADFPIRLSGETGMWLLSMYCVLYSAFIG